jgi:hypothetical protein
LGRSALEGSEARDPGRLKDVSEELRKASKTLADLARSAGR